LGLRFWIGGTHAPDVSGFVICFWICANHAPAFLDLWQCFWIGDGFSPGVSGFVKSFLDL
jgi:hypothetical protein